MQPKSALIRSLCGALLCGVAWAQEVAPDAGEGQPETVLIVAEREARTSKGATGLDLSLAETPQSVTVIDPETAEPALRVTYLSLGAEPGHALLLSVAARSGEPGALGYNQVALDPESGAVQARREWGAVSLSRENLLPLLYKLHYSLHIPDAGALELGVLVMGIVGIVWTLDAFAALAVSFPRRASWCKSFAFRWGRGGYPLHSGRILGLPGRVPVSALGLAVAVLSATGIVIWWRKRRRGLQG